MSELKCPNCRGLGSVLESEDTKTRPGPAGVVPCAVCDGSGSLPIEPDAHGNDFVTFGDGTGAVHAGGSWWLVTHPDDEAVS